MVIASQLTATLTAKDHLRITATALRHWAIAQLQDSLAVGILWLVGLWIIHVPWAPLWAALAAVLQIIPHFGPILSPARTSAKRHHRVERLAPSAVRADSLCGNCGD